MLVRPFIDGVVALLAEVVVGVNGGAGCVPFHGNDFAASLGVAPCTPRPALRLQASDAGVGVGESPAKIGDGVGAAPNNLVYIFVTTWVHALFVPKSISDVYFAHGFLSLFNHSGGTSRRCPLTPVVGFFGHTGQA